MTTDFLEVLNRLGIDLTAREITETLWLAMRITASDIHMPTPAAISNQQDQPPVSFDDSMNTPEIPRRSKSGELYLRIPEKSGEGINAVSFRSPSAIALPGASAIAKALRPLMRRQPSRTRQELNVERTVEVSAHTGASLIEMKPRSERWLEVALVVDQSISMRVWEPTIRELRRLLECHGAFRNVRVWSLDADKVVPLLFQKSGSGTSDRKQADPRQLCGTEGRQIVIALSDCISAGWRNGAAFQLLAEWGRKAPTLLVQMLPQRLWPMTALPQIEARLGATAPGLPNVRLQNHGVSEQNTKSTPMPLAILEGWAVAPWTRLVAGRGNKRVAGFLIPRKQMPPPDSDQSDNRREEEERVDEFNQKSADEQARIRVEEFHKVATHTAFELACYLTAVELSLPVMQLVQQAMLPHSRQLHLAEVLLGGLIRPRTGTSEAIDGVEEILYEFHPGVCELLSKQYITRRDLLRVVGEVSRLIENRLPFAFGFHSVLTQPGQTGEFQIGDNRLPFACLRSSTLERLGFKVKSSAIPSEVPQSSPTGPSSSTTKVAPNPKLPTAKAAGLTAKVEDISRLIVEPPILPPPPDLRQQVMVIGPVGSGKTYLLLALGRASAVPEEKLHLRFIPGPSDPDHTPSESNSVSKASASELMKKWVEVITGEKQGDSTVSVTDYSFEITAEGEFPDSRGKTSYESSTLDVTVSDAPGGALFLDETDKNIAENTISRWHDSLIAKTRRALAIVLCVDAAAPNRPVVEKNLLGLIDKIAVENHQWQTGRRHLNADRFLLLLNKIDLVCVNQGIRPDQFAAQIDPIEMANDKLGVALLNQIRAYLKPDAKFAVGVASALGFHSTTGMPVMDESHIVPKGEETLLTWRPFGVRESLFFIVTGRATGSIRLIKEDLRLK